MADLSTPPNPPRPRRIRAIVHKPVDGGMQFDKDALKDLLFLVVLPLLALIATYWIAVRYVKPAPPDNFVMTTGAPGGAYDLFAQRYRDILRREGITITLKPSAGSIENLQRLKDPNLHIDVGLVQGGLVEGTPPEGLTSLGTVYYEPLWIFYRGKENLDKLSQLASKRIAIGPEGSGTRPLALQLLKASGALVESTELFPLGGLDAEKALVEGSVDAVLQVAATDAPSVQAFMKAKEIKLASLAQAEGFTRRFTFLSMLRLPRGAIDLALDLPPHDINLLATSANLVVKDDFHPALGYLLLEAATEVHGQAGLLQQAGEFPAPNKTEFPLADEATRFYKSGTPFLYRYLPFWVANFMQRMLIVVLPLVAIVIPLLRFLPMLIEWRAKSRLFKWYENLKELERDVSMQPGGGNLDDYLERLDEIERGVNNTRISRNYSDWAYNLRSHIDLVRHRIERLGDQRS